VKNIASEETIMAHSYHHAVSSARQFGGTASDYQSVHDWLDESKMILADFRHRALRHHAEGCFAAEAVFGTTITNSDGKHVPVRLIAEQHIREDLGRIPSFADCVRRIRPEPWMLRGNARLDGGEPAEEEEMQKDHKG
jgi:hypothetical protein